MSRIPLDGIGAWAGLPFFAGDLAGAAPWPALEARVIADAREHRVLPPASDVFNAFRLTPPEAVRVVILGQDPYPTPGHAHGLAFSVRPDVRPLPRSLANIYREMRDDIGDKPDNGDLSHWARQGVLLLNTALTVRAGAAGAHAGYGWSALIDEAIAHAARLRPLAFVLWGRHAQARRKGLDSGAHLFIETAHPSPLSARRGFFGSRPFSRVNDWLGARGEAPVDWAGTGL